MSSSWHLAIESSGLGGSVALFRYESNYRGELHSQQCLPADCGSVRSLAPTIESLLREAQLAPSHLSSLSVTCGPGSFTGLRVGLATAKMLAWTLNIPVMPVDTLEAIAGRFAQSALPREAGFRNAGPNANPNSMPDQYRLVAAINAFRRQVFTSSWLVHSAGLSNGNTPRLECRRPSTVIDAEKWLADPWQGETDDAAPSPGSLWISGGAIATYPALDASRYRLADQQLWQPLAEQVGQLGLMGLAEGRGVSAQQLEPNYIRSSAAEENLRR